MTERRFFAGAVGVLIVGEAGITIAAVFQRPLIGFSLLIGAGIVGLAGFWKSLDDTFHGRDR